MTVPGLAREVHARVPVRVHPCLRSQAGNGRGNQRHFGAIVPEVLPSA